MAIAMERTRLVGHKGTINDLSVSKRVPLVATAADDKSVRVWDERTNKTVKCFHDLFASSPQMVRFSLDNDSILYAADEKSLYELDLRMEGLLVRSPLCTILNGDGLSPDITAITISSGKIAIGDENGTVTVYNTISESDVPEDPLVFRDKHTNLIGSLSISHGSPHYSVYSGGFDSLLVKWSSESKKEVKNFNFGSFYTGNMNPPFVHAVSTVALGGAEEFIVCALGNGRICLLNGTDLSPMASAEASGGMVCDICALGSLVCSAGNHVIKVWDIKQSLSPTEEPVSSGSASQRRRRRKKDRKASESVINYDFVQIGNTVNHDKSINSIAGVLGDDEKFKVYVADISSAVSVYEILI